LGQLHRIAAAAAAVADKGLIEQDSHNFDYMQVEVEKGVAASVAALVEIDTKRKDSVDRS